MNILHNNLLCRKHIVAKENTSGLVLPDQKETVYEVVLAGPKVQGIAIGDRLKPFKYSGHIAEIQYEGEALHLFNQDQIQDLEDA